MKAKKLAAVALSLCLTVPMFSTIVSAADGSLMFSDPQTKVMILLHFSLKAERV